jgi:hypothetical protein
MVERRIHPRQDLWLPVQVDGTAAGIAVTHNASRNGLLIVTAGRAVVGATVAVAFCVPGNESTALGRVVRVGPNDDDPEGLWPYAMAVEFETPLPDIEMLKKALESS